MSKNEIMQGLKEISETNRNFEKSHILPLFIATQALWYN